MYMLTYLHTTNLQTYIQYQTMGGGTCLTCAHVPDALHKYILPVSQGATVYDVYAKNCLLFVQALHSNSKCDLAFKLHLYTFTSLNYLADWI